MAKDQRPSPGTEAVNWSESGKAQIIPDEVVTFRTDGNDSLIIKMSDNDANDNALKSRWKGLSSKALTNKKSIIETTSETVNSSLNTKVTTSNSAMDADVNSKSIKIEKEPRGRKHIASAVASMRESNGTAKSTLLWQHAVSMSQEGAN